MLGRACVLVFAAVRCLGARCRLPCLVQAATRLCAPDSSLASAPSGSGCAIARECCVRCGLNLRSKTLSRLATRVFQLRGVRLCEVHGECKCECEDIAVIKEWQSGAQRSCRRASSAAHLDDEDTRSMNTTEAIAIFPRLAVPVANLLLASSPVYARIPDASPI